MIELVDAKPVVDESVARATEPPPPRSRRGIGGPRTPEGKSRAARNALKHGLRAKTLLPEDLAEVVARRTSEFAADLQPETPYQHWLVAQAARASAQLDRCAEMTLLHRQHAIDRAEDFWDDDQRLEIEDLGARLPRDPARVARQLTRSLRGLDWMVLRWEGLARVARGKGTWSAEQRRLALDLLGVPHELRDASTAPAEDADAETLIAFAHAQIVSLNAIRPELEELDETEHTLARLGMPRREDAPTRALKRYEAECRRTLRWALAELSRVRETAATPAPEAARGRSTEPSGASKPVEPRRDRVPSERFRDRQPEDEALSSPDSSALYDAWLAARIDSDGPSASEPSIDPAAIAPPTGNRRARRYQAKLARQAASRLG